MDAILLNLFTESVLWRGIFNLSLLINTFKETTLINPFKEYTYLNI